MVMPNPQSFGPTGPQGPLTLFDLAGQMVPPMDPTVAPKDDPQFIAGYACAALDIDRDTKATKPCADKGCKRCELRMKVLEVNAFLAAEVVAVAYTGDATKLDSVVAFVQRLKTPPPPVSPKPGEPPF